MVGICYISIISVHTDILMEIADFFNLRMSTPTIQALTWYTDNSNDSNSVINLISLHANSTEIDNHFILLDLWSLSHHASLTVNIIIEKETFKTSNKQS